MTTGGNGELLVGLTELASAVRHTQQGAVRFRRLHDAAVRDRGDRSRVVGVIVASLVGIERTGWQRRCGGLSSACALAGAPPYVRSRRP